MLLTVDLSDLKMYTHPSCGFPCPSHEGGLLLNNRCLTSLLMYPWTNCQFACSSSLIHHNYLFILCRSGNCSVPRDSGVLSLKEPQLNFLKPPEFNPFKMSWKPPYLPVVLGWYWFVSPSEDIIIIREARTSCQSGLLSPSH